MRKTGFNYTTYIKQATSTFKLCIFYIGLMYNLLPVFDLTNNKGVGPMICICCSTIVKYLLYY